jgi:hypothetical protein
MQGGINYRDIYGGNDIRNPGAWVDNRSPADIEAQQKVIIELVTGCYNGGKIIVEEALIPATNWYYLTIVGIFGKLFT